MREEIFSKILRITELQIEALDKEDLEQFDELTKERQVQIDKLTSIDATSGKKLVGEEAILLEKIKDEDAMMKKKYIKLMDEIKDKLKGIRQARSGSNYYNNPYDSSQEEGMFFDKRGR